MQVTLTSFISEGVLLIPSSGLPLQCLVLSVDTSDSSELAVITLFCCPLAEEVCLEVAVMFVVMSPGGYVGSRRGG